MDRYRSGRGEMEKGNRVEKWIDKEIEHESWKREIQLKIDGQKSGKGKMEKRKQVQLKGGLIGKWKRRKGKG